MVRGDQRAGTQILGETLHCKSWHHVMEVTCQKVATEDEAPRGLILLTERDEKDERADMVGLLIQESHAKSL
jgi:hypothetical protein